MEENKNIISDDNPVNNQSQPVTDNGSNTENDVHRKFSFKEFFRELWKRLKDLVNIADDTDIAATVNNISKGVEFKGDNVWVLFFAIVIASVGLNVNSTAVIIGAMLFFAMISFFT